MPYAKLLSRVDAVTQPRGGCQFYGRARSSARGSSARGGWHPGRSNDLAQVGDSGNVFIDCVGGNYVTTHGITLERRPLPSRDGGWSIAFHPEVDRAVVFTDSGEESIPVSELFSKELLVNSRGQNYIGEYVKGAFVIRELVDLQCKYKEGVLSVRIGPSSARSELTVFCFLKPRGCGSHLFVNYIDVYKVLKFGTYGKCPSRWVSRCRESWTKFLTQSIGGNHIVLGNQVDEDDLPFNLKCLPRLLGRRTVKLVASYVRHLA